MKYPRRLCRPLTLLSIVICSVPMLLAKEETTRLRPAETVGAVSSPASQATTTPFSNTSMTLRLSVDGQEPVTLTQREGGLIRVERLPRAEGESSVIVGFTPISVIWRRGQSPSEQRALQRLSGEGLQSERA